MINTYLGHEYEISRDFFDDNVVYAQICVGSKTFTGIGNNSNFDIAKQSAIVHCALKVGMFVAEHNDEITAIYEEKFELLKKRLEYDTGISLLNDARTLKAEYEKIKKFLEDKSDILQDAKKYLMI